MAMLRDMVKETTVTQGNGTLFLQGAAPGGYSPFEDFFADGEVVTYAQFQENSGWEVCRGQFLIGPPRLTKDHTYASMLGINQPVIWGEGVRDVYCAVPASEILTVTEAATVLAATFLSKAGNLAGLANTGTSQTNLGGTATGKALFTAADAAAGRTALALGTAATKNTGTAAGNVVEVLTGSKLPVLDGSNLTGISGGAGVLNAPTGTILSFGGAPPTGWTRNNETEQLMPMFARSGDTPGTVAGGWPITGLTINGNTGGTALSVANLPAHSHMVTYLVPSGGATGAPAWTASGSTSLVNQATDSTGSGTPHEHTLASVPIDSDGLWRPRYRIWVKATKD